MSQDDLPVLLTVDEILSRGARARLRVTGELDLSNSDLLEDALSDQLAVPRRFVRVDLAGLTFCDGIGLDMLDRVHTRFESAGGALKFTNVSENLTRLMEITDLVSLRHSSNPQERHRGTAEGAVSVPSRRRAHLHSV